MKPFVLLKHLHDKYEWLVGHDNGSISTISDYEFMSMNTGMRDDLSLRDWKVLYFPQHSGPIIKIPLPKEQYNNQLEKPDVWEILPRQALVDGYIIWLGCGAHIKTWVVCGEPRKVRL